MHAGHKFNCFESFVCHYTDPVVRKLVEHKEEWTNEHTRQQCYIMGKPDLTIGIGYSFHAKRPRRSDFRVDIKLDGQLVYRRLVKEHYHRLRAVDRILRRGSPHMASFAITIEETDLIEHRYRLMTPDSDDGNDVERVDDDDLEFGTITIEVYRGHVDRENPLRESLACHFTGQSLKHDTPIPDTMRDMALRISSL
ncbi:hypothetical protein BD324DRAFT_213287 [Kockovaella imperatae]|uniref:Uncharacterized protein n=1 Tax=Kockovaella imperatae TaxID=4999 RepID=A0A1Y1U6T0_9TREE|nr:hypothetical protein BD324DRAFT_213287 [Kockovaella imperatae]ORX33702.1 hypothetical protein BD324DRAFT_213287 [Kockovaella imperatae]